MQIALLLLRGVDARGSTHLRGYNLFVLRTDVLKSRRVEEQVDLNVGAFLRDVFENMSLLSIDLLHSAILQLDFAGIQIQQGPGGRECAAKKTVLINSRTLKNKIAQSRAYTRSDEANDKFLSIITKLLSRIISVFETHCEHALIRLGKQDREPAVLS